MKLFSSMVLLGCLSLSAGGAVQAQEYPSRPVQVMIGFPPGGSSDIVGRYVMQKMTDLTGNQFVVENRTGAGGNLAFAAVAAAKPASVIKNPDVLKAFLLIDTLNYLAQVWARKWFQKSQSFP